MGVDDDARREAEQPMLAGSSSSHTADIEKQTPPISTTTTTTSGPSIHAAFYIAAWISLSSATILFNKYILSTAGFPYPILLTAFHMAVCTIMTQLMARFTTTLDSRKTVPMSSRRYARIIIPIGLTFSGTLITGNLAYLYLSVSFIQVLKATMPVVTLLISWALGVVPPSLKTLGNVSFTVLGVVIASYGEIHFVLIGFFFQSAAIIFEAIRLVLVQKLLSGPDYNMNSLVSLYYFAPVCTLFITVIALFTEIPRVTLAEVQNVGYFVFFINGMVAFVLNVSSVALIGKTSSLVMTLSGVLKNILLVLAAVVIFSESVSALQVFGYGIALAGLVWYKLGAEKSMAHIGTGYVAWKEWGSRNSIRRKMVVLGIFASIFGLFASAAAMVGLWPHEWSPARMLVNAMDWLFGAGDG